MPFVGDNIFPDQSRKRKSEGNYDKLASLSHRDFTGKQQQSQPAAAPFSNPPQRKVASFTKRARTAAASESDGQRLRASSLDAAPGGNPVTAPTRYTSAMLAPCYICYRHPMRKTELNRYTGCERCGKRVCDICLRQCEGRNASLPVQDTPMLSPSAPESEVIMDDEYDYDNDIILRDEPDAQQRTQGRRDASTRDTERPGLLTEHRAVICSRCCVERGTDGEVMCLGCLSREAA